MAENWTNLAEKKKKMEFYRTRKTCFLKLCPPSPMVTKLASSCRALHPSIKPIVHILYKHTATTVIFTRTSFILSLTDFCSAKCEIWTKEMGRSPAVHCGQPHTIDSDKCTEQCTQYTVQCTLYTVHCIVYIVKYTLYSVYCTLML